jgi:hypothetical protein
MICDVPINNSSSSSSDEEKSNANSNMIHDYYSCRRCTQLQPELKQCKFSEHCRTPQEQSTKPLARVAEHSGAPLAAGAHAVCTSRRDVAQETAQSSSASIAQARRCAHDPLYKARSPVSNGFGDSTGELLDEPNFFTSLPPKS